MSTINLSTVRSQMSDLFAVTKDLDGIDLDDTEGIDQPRQWAAEVSRDLLHLADSLDLLGALVRNEYWKTKGYEDRATPPVTPERKSA